MSQEPERQDLVEPEGVNAGSTAAERDRLPSGDIDVTTAAGEPQRDADAPEGLLGTPFRTDHTPGQEYAVGEG